MKTEKKFITVFCLGILFASNICAGPRIDKLSKFFHNAGNTTSSLSKKFDKFWSAPKENTLYGWNSFNKEVEEFLVHPKENIAKIHDYLKIEFCNIKKELDRQLNRPLSIKINNELVIPLKTFIKEDVVTPLRMFVRKKVNK